MTRHLLTLNRLKCPKCPNNQTGFARTEDLRTHEERVHRGARFACENCDQDFVDKAGIKQHRGGREGLDICPKSKAATEEALEMKIERDSPGFRDDSSVISVAKRVRVESETLESDV